jgi:nitric oxide reductase NorD protein
VQRHRSLVRTIRHHFERLRARRMLLNRELAGDELDIAAWVDAVVDRHTGDAPDDRLYREARPARRGLAISLLVDVSGSTETRVADGLRIVDLEKIRCCWRARRSALGDVRGPRSGKTAADVRVSRIKVSRSLAAMHSPADRDATARLRWLERCGGLRVGTFRRRAARHRLLVILSDGRPNGVDPGSGSRRNREGW